MSKIKVLPPEITNLIAAGEVVERPASIVKELIENSIDAGATRIRINIQAGGRKLVQISDNGCGMDAEDAQLCLQPHATSKIKTESDVEHIRTMGFRGEALPSIAAVTQFNILTRQQKAPMGTEVIVNAGVVEDVRDAGSAPGTTITAKNLFFNMPVRKKFLRTKQTESIHIQNTVQMQALANPEISFELIMDGKVTIKATAGNLAERALALLGKNWLGDMIPVNYEESEIGITGYVGRPGISRSTRKDQIFFINRRPVVSDTLYHAVKDAFFSMVAKGRYAPCLVFLEMHAGLVDVNVHPQKREVRFRNNMLIGSVLCSAIKDAIANFQMSQQNSAQFTPGQQAETFDNPIRPGFSSLQPSDLESRIKPGTVDISPEELEQIRRTTASILNPEELDIPVETPPPVTVEHADAEPVEMPANPFSEPEVVADDIQPETTSKEPIPEPPPFPEPEPFPLPEVKGLSNGAVEQKLFQNEQQELFSHLRIIGSLSSRFILAEGDDGLVVIDQSAAHSRIIYEDIMQKSTEEEAPGQQLLLPITIDVSNSDRLVITKNMEMFNKIGFGLDHFGGNTYIISAVPALFPQENIIGLFQQIIDDLLQSSSSATPKATDIKLAQLAAKYAVKASRNLCHEEIVKLLKDLSRTKMPYTCPNGQPTMVNYSISELNRRFGIKR